MENKITNNPIKTFSCGAVKAAIWLNCLEKNGTLVEIHSIRINKSYKDKGDNEWKRTDNLAAEDLPKVAVVATEAYKFIRMRESEPVDQLSNSGADEVE
jgi:hypothetical protein